MQPGTTKFANTCPQPQGNAFAAPSNTEYCLYLSVFTPDSAPNRASRRPVMVWFPGGGLFSGESNDHDGSKLARLGDLVVVTQSTPKAIPMRITASWTGNSRSNGCRATSPLWWRRGERDDFRTIERWMGAMEKRLKRKMDEGFSAVSRRHDQIIQIQLDQQAGIRGLIAAAKIHCEFLAMDRWQVEGKRCSVGHAAVTLG